MTVASELNRIQYAGNGSQTIFPYTFKIFTNTDLKVYLTDVLGGETLLTLTTHYSVSGVGSETGGNVTMVTPPATGETLTIIRQLPLTQETDYTEADKFPAQSHENALDRQVMIAQQLNEQLTRCPQFNPGSGVSNVVLPVPQAGKFLMGNDTGTGYENADISESSIVATGMDVAGYVKNTAAGVLQGGQTLPFATNSEAQAQTDPAKIITPANISSLKGIANGLAGLDANAKVPTAQLGGAGASANNFLCGDQTWKSTSISFYSNYLTADVTMTNGNQFYDGPSLTLNPGTYLLLGHIYIYPTTNNHSTVKLWNGTTVKACTNMCQHADVALMAVVVLTATETWKISAAAADAGYIIKATPFFNNSGCENKLTYLHAIKIG